MGSSNCQKGRIAPPPASQTHLLLLLQQSAPLQHLQLRLKVGSLLRRRRRRTPLLLRLYLHLRQLLLPGRQLLASCHRRRLVLGRLPGRCVQLMLKLSRRCGQAGSALL
jgi:hypothetical protein